MADNSVRFSLETPVGAGTVLAAQVDEALDQPYRARVRFDVADGAADLEAVLGHDVVLTWERDAYARKLCGLVHRVREMDRTDSSTELEIEIVPALAMLALSRNTRMFQEKTVPEILAAVLSEKLGAYSREMIDELGAEYPAREYCLQYQESDLDFVHRLMDEEGIAYSFDHEGGKEKMILRDANDQYARVAGAADPVMFDADVRAIVEAEPIVRFERRHGTTTTAVALRDFDWTLGGYIVQNDTGGGADAAGRTRESYEHGLGRSATIGSYDQGAKSYQKEDTARQKDVRLEAHVTGAVIGAGVSQVCGLIPGGTIEISGHPGSGVDGEYLLTRVQHSERSLPGSNDGYHNRFECIPLATPHRPRRRVQKPRVASVQTAVVTGDGEEIYTDEHGRVKVQFHWDRENPADETSSCWIRVQQKWAGAGWGFWWLPRVGMEVVVQFIDGDPDRPLVTGTVYNGTNATPYTLPDDKTKSTIKSNSSPGGGGFNELRFEDKTGSEEIFTHAQKDYNEVVENDHTTQVGHDQTIQVDNNQTQTIHANQTEDVGANQSLTVDGNRTVHVESNFDETVDGTETRNVTGAVDETFDADETRDIAGDVTESISANETRTISGSQTETISGNLSVTITGSSTETITGALAETITGAISTTTAGNWTVTAPGGFNITAAGGLTITATGGWTIAAPGGVNSVDTFLDWLGSKKADNGAFKRSFVLMKNEAYGASLGFTQQKVEATGISVPNHGLQATIGTDDKGAWGAEIKLRSLDLKKYGATLEN
jgi:type VI secretion system secreted protein VgrG